MMALLSTVTSYSAETFFHWQILTRSQTGEGNLRNIVLCFRWKWLWFSILIYLNIKSNIVHQCFTRESPSTKDDFLLVGIYHEQADDFLKNNSRQLNFYGIFIHCRYVLHQKWNYYATISYNWWARNMTKQNKLFFSKNRLVLNSFAL